MQIDPEHSCEGEKQYPNKQWAKGGMRNIEIENRNRMRFGVGGFKNMGKLNVYLCPFCGFWHIGHSTWKRV